MARDLFPAPGQQPSLSCRLYPGERGRLGPAPSAARLREALCDAVVVKAGRAVTTCRRHKPTRGQEPV